MVPDDVHGCDSLVTNSNGCALGLQFRDGLQPTEAAGIDGGSCRKSDLATAGARGPLNTSDEPLAEMTAEPPLGLVVVTDPLCSWCWGMAPAVEDVADRFAAMVRFDLLLGGVNVDSTLPVGA